jgi:hypothetical protein
MGPIWYEKSVKEWEAKEEDRRRGSRSTNSDFSEIGGEG